eukprot:Gregarina_sp_Poly_1__1821@NODE_1472_length_4056_cov_103_411632_g975_i0_p3_GENE_NODE_1472_length_4056_cov_103_411632_g975_i0NODE_1472_length_4056_cov_103_411632_g975_i0_p3_ORF_typecomplete_len324_score58_24Leo1/PF04004_13/5_4e03Leo1/PF04004_13/1_7e12_NODE_1472_length_4056_cov_103_411632_g975_i05861557
MEVETGINKNETESVAIPHINIDDDTPLSDTLEVDAISEPSPPLEEDSGNTKAAESTDDAAARRHAIFKRSAFNDDDDDYDENEAETANKTPARTQLFDDEEDFADDSVNKVETASDSRALFDDDEDLRGADGDDTDAEDDEGYQDSGQASGMYEFEGGEEGGLEYVTLPVQPPLKSPGASDELWLIGLPLSVSVIPELFDAEEMAEKERAANSENLASKKRAISQQLAPGKIRLRRNDDGEITSNARLVEFCDGSCALFIGTTVYEADARSEGKSILIEGSQAPLYRVHGIITHKRIFKPPNVSAMDGRNIRIQPNKEKVGF